MLCSRILANRCDKERIFNFKCSMTENQQPLQNNPTKILLRMNNFGPFLTDADMNRGLSSESQFDGVLINLLESFFGRPVKTLDKDILGRYKEITTQETHVNLTPSYQNIIERVIDPLISAKRQYCLGEYLASIALSGIIGEMLSLLIWRMNNFHIGQRTVSKEDEHRLFGETFERIRQERREDILIATGAIDETAKTQFKEIRTIRNKYVHSWDYDTRQQKGDAKKLIQNAFKLYKTIADMTLVVEEGKQTISINPKLLKFLKESNLEEIDNI